MNNPFDYIPDQECVEAFRKLTARLDALKMSENPDDISFCRELDDGKMLGVLIAEDPSGAHHPLFAFSGQLGDAGFHYPGFVGPVFDYLQPDGYFKRQERDISRQNIEIAQFEKGALALALEEYNNAKVHYDAEVERYKEHCRLSKSERQRMRESGMADDADMAAMIRQSQFEKAELHRLKKRVAAELEPLAGNLQNVRLRLEAMKEKRRTDSEALQSWLFNNFLVLNARGESRNLRDIFADTSLGIPPSGAGECCGPKLLQAAYLRGWKPVSMAEYWYGRPKGGEVRIHGSHYPACRGKCLPVLGWMLQGLDIQPPLDCGDRTIPSRMPEIIYENRWFCVVDKPAGMLSVPGKGAALSVQQWLTERYGAEREVRMAHRLDRDTSGLIIAAFGTETYKLIQSLFATRKIEKRYVADLEGDYRTTGIDRQGSIALPLSPDWLDRPRQRVDLDEGKQAVTDYEFMDVTAERSRIFFYPRTGRTHQLRVHAASEMGLGMPIVGDPLYGSNPGSCAERLHLHAQRIEFIFPTDGRRYCFESPVPF